MARPEPPSPPPVRPPADDDGGGGGGGSAAGPSIDPVVAQRMSMFAQIYLSLWGEPATEAYLRAAAESGLNSYEFAMRERAKPAWWTTKQAKDAVARWTEMMARAGV